MSYNQINMLNDIANSKVNLAYNQLTLGKVIFRKDPLKLGRVKVYLPNVYGELDVENEENIKLIPWCLPLAGTLAGDDKGIYNIPDIDDFVYIMFLNGNVETPVYFGGFWKYKDESNIPKEARTDEEPLKKIFKTKKGTTIIINEEDEKENLKIIDRAGQIIEMSSPIKKGNQKRREDGTVDENSKFTIDDFVDNKGYIKIKDIAGQEFIMSSEKDKEKIQMLSTGTGENRSQITLDNTKDNEKIIMQDIKNQKILLDTKNESASIETNKGKMYIDKDGAIGSEQGSNKIKIDKDGNGNLEGAGDMVMKFKSISIQDVTGKGIEVANGIIDINGNATNMNNSGIVSINGTLLRLMNGTKPVSHLGSKTVGSPGTQTVIDGNPKILV